MRIGEIMVNIVNIYAPNLVSDCKSFFSCLHHFISQSELIIGGDFNCVDSSGNVRASSRRKNSRLP